MADGQPVFKHILVPVDGSQSSINAGRLAISLASQNKARLTFFYVVDKSTADRIAVSSKKDPRLVEVELAASGDRCLRRLSRQSGDAGLESKTLIRRGEPHKEIGALARELRADLVVIGQIGRYGLQRVLIGSVTERVIEDTDCPVLVVR